MNENHFESVNKKIDLIFAENPEDLLINVRSHLKKENLDPLSLNIIKEHNSFCALVVGEPLKRISFSS